MQIVSEDEYLRMLDNFIQEHPLYSNIYELAGTVGPEKTEKNPKARKVTVDFYTSLSKKAKTAGFNLPKELLDILILLDIASGSPTILIGNTEVYKNSSVNLLSYSAAEKMSKVLQMGEELNWLTLVSVNDSEITDVMQELNVPEITNKYPSVGRFFNIIISAMEGEDEEVELKPTKDLSGIVDLFRKYDIKNSDDRIKIYEYWDETQSVFNSLGNETFPFPQEVSYDSALNITFADKKFQEELLGYKDIEDFNKVRLSIIKKLTGRGGIKLPKFTVTYKGDISMSQYEDKVTLIKLASDFLQAKTGDTREYQELFTRGSGETSQREELNIKDTDTGSQTTTTTSVDPTEQVGEVANQKINKVKKIGDPLALLSAFKKGGFFIDWKLADGIKNKIKSEMTEQLTNVRQEIIQSRIEAIDAFADELISDFTERESYTFSIIDDTKNKTFLSRLNHKQLVLSYYELELKDDLLVFTKKDTPFDNYFKYVDTINEMVKNTMKVINDIKNIIPESMYNINAPRGARLRGSGQTAYTRGGSYPSTAGKFAESKPEKKYQDFIFIYDELIKLVNAYYYETLDPRFFFHNDAPEFTKDSNYKKIISLSTKSRKSVLAGMKRSMVKRKNINLDKKDLDTLANFFEKLKYYGQLGPAEMIEIFQEVEPIFNNLYLADLVLDEGQSKREVVTKITSDIRNSLGKFIFDLLKSSGNLIESVEYEGKPIKEYENKQFTLGNLRLFDVLEDPDFEQYALDNKMETSLKNLVREMNDSPLTIKRELTDKDAMYKAYIEALDLLKDDKNQMIYKAFLQTDNVEHVEYALDLIAKEDKIDLYARDIEGIVESNDSFNTLSYLFGVSPDIIYKVKGLFR